jgi:hypothetical protein
MSLALDHFETNMRYSRDVVDLSRALDSATAPVVDVSDFLRAAIVLSVSALDHFVHERVRMGMADAFGGLPAGTDALERFRVPLANVRRGLADPSDLTWLEAAIRTEHSFLAFQRPGKIAAAVRLISPVELWNSVGRRMGEDPRTVRATLDVIIDRRNKIAHEADIDPAFPPTRWPISFALIDDAIAFLDTVVHVIDDVV